MSQLLEEEIMKVLFAVTGFVLLMFYSTLFVMYLP